MERLTQAAPWLKEMLPWVFATVLSLWGGVAHYAMLVRNGEPPSWMGGILVVVVCMFSGHLGFFMSQRIGLTEMDMATTVSLCAFGGPAALKHFLKSKLGVETP